MEIFAFIFIGLGISMLTGRSYNDGLADGRANGFNLGARSPCSNCGKAPELHDCPEQKGREGEKPCSPAQ